MRHIVSKNLFSVFYLEINLSAYPSIILILMHILFAKIFE